jgi:MGT family glycosyltransferase
MKSRHIAVFTAMGNTHVHPTLGLCSELVRRGHRVTFPTTARYESEVTQTGAEPVVLKELKVHNAAPPPKHDQHFWSIWASTMGPLLLIDAASALPQIDAFYRTNRPDSILYESDCFLGRMLAARLGCSAIKICPHFARYRGNFIRENGVFSTPKPIYWFSKVLDFFFQAYGIKDTDNLWHEEELNIYLIPREFQVHGESFDDRFCFVGPCLNRPAGPVWKSKNGGKPIVLVSGSQVEDDTTYFKAMIDALSGKDVFVVLSLDANVSDEALDPLPENMALARTMHNSQILPQAALLISQGDTGMIMESMHFGVPVLVIPRTPHHAETGYRVQELGIGEYLPEGMLSIDAIGKNVARLLADPMVADRVARMQKIVRLSGGSVAAANHIEEALRFPRPT